MSNPGPRSSYTLPFVQIFPTVPICFSMFLICFQNLSICMFVCFFGLFPFFVLLLSVSFSVFRLIMCFLRLVSCFVCCLMFVFQICRVFRFVTVVPDLSVFLFFPIDCWMLKGAIRTYRAVACLFPDYREQGWAGIHVFCEYQGEERGKKSWERLFKGFLEGPEALWRLRGSASDCAHLVK